MANNQQDNILNNRYRLDAQHGSGGMSVIYKATDLALGRLVAIKILRPSLTSDPTFLARFRQEARNVANLQHPNIVTVHDVGQDGNTYYIVMELIDGEDLKKRIRTEAPLPIDKVLDYAIKICAGIGYAHRAGLVHADVKPQNVLLVENNVKVTDFGIAQALAATDPNERKKVVWGSPHYFSPEQAQGRNPTPASDVYSIGIVLFEMLTGRLPFMGTDQQELAWAHIRQTPPHVTEIAPAVPEQLERIVQKVLAKEPAQRYRMADQLGRILINYRDQGLGKTNNQNNPVVVSSPPTLQSAQAKPVQKSPYASPDSPEYTASNAASTPETTAPPTLVKNPMPETTAPNSYTSPNPPNIRESGYYTPVDPPQMDVATLVLAFVAFLAVVGMIILWMLVFQAYY